MNTNKPDMSIETSSCISSLATHPEYPSVVAVGFFNGEIHVYNTREAESLPTSILDKREMHKDEVTCLKWIKDVKTSKKKYLVYNNYYNHIFIIIIEFEIFRLKNHKN
jgi:WD40 repeat protein